MMCVICDKIKEKKALMVYEDANLVAILPAKPAVPGHIKIMPKQHYTKFEEMSDDLVEELFFLANFASASAFETMKAHGTNIILNESESHLAVDIIPRREGDGLNFTWKPKEMSPDELDSLHARVKDKAFVIGKKEEKQEEKPIILLPEEKKEEIIKIPKEDKTNYLIKHLTKIP